MFSKFVHSRARHVLILIPLGLIVGTVVGALFNDVLFGLLAGFVLGLLFSGLFALRTH